MSNDTEGSLWSSLPDFAKEVTYDYEGNVMQKNIRPKYIRDIMDFKVRPDDIFLITFPKSGTTWVQRIICLILEEGSDSSNTHLLKKVPFLEMPQGFSSEPDIEPPGRYELANDKPSPRFMKTHLRMKFLPREIETKKPKIVYVARNPKDNAVSYFNFCSLTGHLPKYKVWSEFLRDFQRGALPRGSWFENVLCWWQKRNEPNVLFLKYEDLQKNLRTSVIQIADFLERNLTDEAIEVICKNSSFTSMKNDHMINPDFFSPLFREGVKENRSFLRKGIVGDWKNYFTVAQSEEFDALYKEKMEGSGLSFDFTLE